MSARKSNRKQRNSAPPDVADITTSATLSDEKNTDASFFSALRSAQLINELTDSLIETLTQATHTNKPYESRLNIIELYYAAAGDIALSRKRTKSDRVLVHHASVSDNIKTIAVRISLCNPEISNLQIERVGGDTGPLILRSGDYISVITDTNDEDDNSQTVTVQSIVKASNNLLHQAGVQVRLVMLPSDDRREIYVGVERECAITLCKQNILEEEDPLQLLEFCSWN